jgi:L-ornithine Nalpha-acyltransferase
MAMTMSNDIDAIRLRLFDLAAKRRSELVRFRTQSKKRSAGLAFMRRFQRRSRMPWFAIRQAKQPKVYGQIGRLQVRLADGHADIRSAQRLRYDVFYREMSAKPSIAARFRQRDEDPFDAVCDHLLVFDGEADKTAGWHSGRKPRVVGTYRVLRQDIAERGPGFYTQGEYDIAPLVQARAKTHTFMELGRSCVLKPYRNKRTVELLWHGLWTYVREHKIDVMIGCASFEGTDLAEHAMALSFLHHYAMAPDDWMVRAHADRRVPMDFLPKEQVDAKAALRALPPLIKGYLRLGAFVGDGAVIDHQFGTVDVLICLPVEKIDPRYFEHFGRPDERESRVAGGRKHARELVVS